MKSTDRILAKRYARAFDALGVTAQEASQNAQALQAAAQALQQAQGFMTDPAVAVSDKKALVAQLFAGEKTVCGFLQLLLESKRYNLLAACVQEVQALLDQRLGVVRPQVQTAFALSAAQQKQVEETLARFAKAKKAHAVFTTDPALLGGLRALVGDVLIDGSLKGQFEKLKEEIIK